MASSMGEADSKFPTSGNSDAIPPSPTRENPAAVYPKSDPSPAPRGTIPGTGPPSHPRPTSSSRSSPLGNPFLLRSVLDDLDASLGRAIDAVRSEGYSPGASNAYGDGGGGGEGVGGAGSGSVLGMFEQWRTELDRLRAGDRPLPSNGSGVGTGAGVVRGRSTRPEHDPSSAESGGMFAD